MNLRSRSKMETSNNCEEMISLQKNDRRRNKKTAKKNLTKKKKRMAAASVLWFENKNKTDELQRSSSIKKGNSIQEILEASMEEGESLKNDVVDDQRKKIINESDDDDDDDDDSIIFMEEIKGPVKEINQRNLLDRSIVILQEFTSSSLSKKSIEKEEISINKNILIDMIARKRPLIIYDSPELRNKKLITMSSDTIDQNFNEKTSTTSAAPAPELDLSNLSLSDIPLPLAPEPVPISRLVPPPPDPCSSTPFHFGFPPVNPLPYKGPLLPSIIKPYRPGLLGICPSFSQPPPPPPLPLPLVNFNNRGNAGPSYNNAWPTNDAPNRDSTSSTNNLSKKWMINSKNTAPYNGISSTSRAPMKKNTTRKYSRWDKNFNKPFEGSWKKNNNQENKYGNNNSATSATTVSSSSSINDRNGHENIKKLPPLSDLRPVIIDGSNVAISYGKKRYFDCRGILLCAQYFIDRGHRVMIFVPQYREEEIINHRMPTIDGQFLTWLNDHDLLTFTPHRNTVMDDHGKPQYRRITCYDDNYIIEYASLTGGIIVSKDNFRDVVCKYPEWSFTINNRLLMFSWVDDSFMPPRDPLGAKGPSLDQFLRFEKSDRIQKPLPALKSDDQNRLLRRIGELLSQEKGRDEYKYGNRW